MASEERIEERQQFGAMLRKAREDAGLSQRQLSALCGIDNADIGRIERAEVDPRLTTLLELADALKLKLTFIKMD